MATGTDASLRDDFARLQEERRQTWGADQLAANVRQRQSLRDAFDPAAVAQRGDRLPSFDFTRPDHSVLTLDDLVADGPAVILFFRFADCPACNLALPHYDRDLAPALRARKIPLIALSPQVPERIRPIADRHRLGFPIATDADNALARHLGIVFAPEDQPYPPPTGWIGEVTGTGTWELPQPAALILAPGRIVRHLVVSPDWLDRPEAQEILNLLDADA